MSIKKLPCLFTCIAVAAVSAGVTLLIAGRKEAIPKAPVETNHSREQKMEAAMKQQFEVEGRALAVPEHVADSLRKYAENKTLLVFHFDNYGCAPCINNAIADLNSFKERIGKQHILVIVSETNRKQAMLLVNKVKSDFNTLWIKNGELQFEGISQRLPIQFFLMTPDMVPFGSYFYMPEFPTLNQAYFNTVAKRIARQ